MSLASKVVTTWRLLASQGLKGLWQEVPERLDWSTGRVTRHPHLRLVDVAISVVVPTFNGGPDLVALLDSLSRQTGCRLEVLILDSGSTDDSRELVAGYPFARWVAIPPGEFSHSQTRNQGVALAQYPLVFLTVQDAVLPDAIWLARLAALLQVENLGALATAEVPRPDADSYARYIVDTPYRWLANGTTQTHSCWRGSRRQRIHAATIGNVACLYRRDLLVRYLFQGSFGEDFTLAMRLLQNGIAVGKTSELKIVHSHNRPAFYSLKRMAVSRRLMAGLDLARPEEAWTEDRCLALVAGLAEFFDDRWAEVQRLDGRLMAWVSDLGLDLMAPVHPHQTLIDIVAEVKPYEPANPEERPALVLKALAGRVGWVLGGVDSSLWSTPQRKTAVEGLANGV